MTNGAIAWAYRFDAQPAVRVSVGGSAETVTLATTAGVDYYVTGDGGSSDLLKILETAIESHTGTPTVSSAVTAAFKASLTGSATLQLLWTNGATTLDPAIFGWVAGADSSTGTTITSPNQIGGLWRAGAPPRLDGRPRQPVLGGVAETLSGLTRTSRFVTPTKTRDLSWHLLPQEVALEEYATTTEPKGALETAWVESISKGYACRYYADEADLDTGAGYSALVSRDVAEPLSRDEQYPLRWAAQLRLRAAS